MQAYLAEKYMSGPKARAILSRTKPSKKKKCKGDSAAGSSLGFAVVDYDGGWGSERLPAKDGDEDDIQEAVVEKDRSFKKRKVGGAESNTWTIVREGTKKDDYAVPEDEKPLVFDAEPVAKGGLLSASELQRKLAPKAPVKEEMTEEEEKAAQETVYRDVSGRRIDTKAERAEAARKKREREEREARKMQWGKGLVQREEEERRKEQLERERKRGLAVYADDKELNDELKAKDRWNDPAAAFLTKKSSKGPKRPEYKGPTPAPNRFGIKPGYRWDGVDRSNGFEKKLFQKLNERKRTGQAAHDWSVEDM